MCGDAAADVIDTVRVQVQTLSLDNTCQTVAQYADYASIEGSLKAGEFACAVVQVGGLKLQVAVLGNQFAALIIEIVSNIQMQTGLALHLALDVAQAVSSEFQVGVLTVDQAVIAVLHQATSADVQPAICRDCAAVTVVQASSQQSQQATADQFTALVVDLRRPLDQYRAAAGQLAAGVGQGAEQVEGCGGSPRDAAGTVVEVMRAQIQSRATIDYTA